MSKLKHTSAQKKPQKRIGQVHTLPHSCHADAFDFVLAAPAQKTKHELVQALMQIWKYSDRQNTRPVREW